jgi:RNA polymerase subunit RPABC4/transcription elongation factor Spt4
MCPKCGRDFTYTQIDTAIVEQALRDPFRILQRPTFAVGGETQTCPVCKSESVYQRYNLFYLEDRPNLAC